ncbi:putative G protein-coupled receptor 85 [Apostichopus japonicus]|uniref:Putative G protein-coupled receptor 85 n=1 Tax=Stichopus japonicus TaxID=307972 RepID=A0A2G8KDD4_STIJA|nr:putative G protein-coupled receptor 85 [Apostichopus japonicus]
MLTSTDTWTVSGISTNMNSFDGEGTDQESKLAEILWIFAMILIIGFSVVGNLTICYAVFKNQSLRKPCFYMLCNIAVADCLRAGLCFPVVILAIWTGNWIYGKFMCDMLAFINIYLYYGVLYTTLFLSVERYLVVRFHRFHRQKLTGLTCLLGVLFAWALSIATAFPPILNPNAYEYASAEFQCTFKRRGFSDHGSESGYYSVFYVADNFLIVIFYVRVFLFMRTHRKMRPLQFIPAISSSWTFYGPGSTGQAATNWFLGYRQNATPPPHTATTQSSTNRTHLALLHPNFNKEERLSKICLLLAIVNILLWMPYMVNCAGIAFGMLKIPNVYITNFTWLTYLQTCASPLICIIFVPEIRMFCCACAKKYPASEREVLQISSQ